MGSELARLIRLLTPIAAQWIAAEESRIEREGVALTESQRADAIAVGVKHPDRVRVAYACRIPTPPDPQVLALGQRLGLEGVGVTGRSFRYGLLIRWDLQGDREQLVHELAHTAQFERFGSIEAFVIQYLLEVAEVGYGRAPLELEAVAAAARVCGPPPPTPTPLTWRRHGA